MVSSYRGGRGGFFIHGFVLWEERERTNKKGLLLKSEKDISEMTRWRGWGEFGQEAEGGGG